MNMKFLVFLGIITTVAAFHQECSLQSCTQHQPYVVDDPCPIHFYSKWYIRVGARKSAPLLNCAWMRLVLNHPFSTSISVIIQFPVYLLQLIARNLNWVVL